jgi:phage terminase small subunit
MDAQDPAGNLPPKLKRRAQLFVSEYLKDLNGTQAAIRAGYSPATARVTASKILANVSISTAIHEAQDKILKENHVTVSRIVHGVSLITFLDPASLYDETHPVSK